MVLIQGHIGAAQVFEGQKKKEPERGANGTFMPSNKFWRQRVNPGPGFTFKTPADLQEACYSYFDWVDDNPLWEMKVFGTGLKMKLPHARAMTLRGLTAHIGIGRRTWDDYRARDEFKDVCELAEDIMFEQKFAGAAAGLFNAAIIARDLGLADKKEIDGTMVIEVIDSYAENPDTE